MSVVWLVLWWLLLLYLLALVARMVIGWVQVASPSWRPRGWSAVLAEAVYTVTDPPLRALGRFIPPLRLGSIALDLSFSLVFLLCFVLLGVVGGLR